MNPVLIGQKVSEHDPLNRWRWTMLAVFKRYSWRAMARSLSSRSGRRCWLAESPGKWPGNASMNAG
ncbi:MAG: hypothetical protein KBF24_11150, partial [Thiobacillaceae bacterium]|nr:hypothetical protein [Thiobacillaceae bacterium]